MRLRESMKALRKAMSLKLFVVNQFMGDVNRKCENLKINSQTNSSCYSSFHKHYNFTASTHLK
jgi:hypothetical protein